MTDVVVTIPKSRWEEWLAEGDLPDTPWSGLESHYYFGGGQPSIQPGDLVYVVAHGKLRGYAPLVRLDWLDYHSWAFVRHGGAVAVTLLEEVESEHGEWHTQPATIKGFRGWRYRWWERREEVPFPDWRTP
jgi:hypothetical protein